MEAFERGPAMITKVHAYLVKELNLAENVEVKSAETLDRMYQITLEAFWTQNVRAERGFERTDSMLEALGALLTTSFLAKVYPALSRFLIKEFIKAIMELSIVVILALFVTFRAENFVKRQQYCSPWDTESPTGWTLDINCDHEWNLEGLMNLTEYPEQMREKMIKFNLKRTKIREQIHTLIQYLLQQNRFVTREDMTLEKEEDLLQGECPY